MDDYLGVVGLGRMVLLNIFEDLLNLDFVIVLLKGIIFCEDGCDLKVFIKMGWSKGGFVLFEFLYDMMMDDLQFFMLMGVKMWNVVIMELYMIEIDNLMEQFLFDYDESYLMMFDRYGKWCVNMIIKGFVLSVQGFVSFFIMIGDIVVIGKNKVDMLFVFVCMKEIGGGIVFVENGNILYEILFVLCGCVFLEVYEEVLEKE